MQYRQWKKEEKLTELALLYGRRSEDSSTQRLHYVMILGHMCVRCTILHYAEPFDATLHRLCVRFATRRNPEPFDLTLHRWSTVLQISAKLFVIELIHFTILCSNSTWATRPCLGCSVSRRKTRPSIIWPCHSFISYAILQLILTPSLYLLIYLTSLYFWWWRPPIALGQR